MRDSLRVAMFIGFLVLVGVSPGLRGHGEPLFALKQEFHGTPAATQFDTAGSRAVALGKLDGDDFLDAVIGGQSGCAIWINREDGTFAAGQVLMDGSFAAVLAVAIEDLDGDGDSDIVILHNRGVNIWINQGGEQGGIRGEFEPRQEFALSSPIVLAVGPLFDASKGPDLYITRGGMTATDVIFRNDPEGRGDFSDIEVARPLGLRYVQFALGDLTGDGRMDAFASTQGTGPFPFANRVLINTGTNFVVGDPFGGSATGLALDFLNRDGHLDAVTIHDSGSLTVWINDGSGRFTGRGVGEPFRYRSVALGDFDGDGASDILGSGEPLPFPGSQGGPTARRLFTNDGNGNFTEIPLPFGSLSEPWTNVTAIAVGDLNNNGLTDVLLLNTGAIADQGRPDQVWLNQTPPPPRADVALRITGQQRRMSGNPLELVLDLDYEIENIGPSPLNNLRLRTDFPPNLLVFLEVRGANPFVPLASPNLWGLETLGPGATATLRLTARKLHPEVGQMVIVTADVRSDEIPNPVQASVTIGTGGIDLGIQIEDRKDPVPLDLHGFPEHAEYHVTVTETRWGNESAENVVVEITTAPSGTIRVPTSVPWESLDLRLLTLGSFAGIPTAGDRVLFVARDTNQVGHPLYFRLFNWGGELIIDRAESELLNLRGEAIATLKNTLDPVWAELRPENFLQTRHEALSVLNHLHWQRLGTGQGVRRVFPGRPPRIDVEVHSSSGVTNRLTARVTSEIFDPNPANNEAVEETWVTPASVNLLVGIGDHNVEFRDCLIATVTLLLKLPQGRAALMPSFSGIEKSLPPSLASYYTFRQLMSATGEGSRMIALYDEHTREMTQIVQTLWKEGTVRTEVEGLYQSFHTALASLLEGGGGSEIHTLDFVVSLNRLADRFVELGSPELREAIETERARFNGLQDFVGKSMVEWAQMLGIEAPQAPFLSASSFFRLENGDLYFEANHVAGHTYSIWQTESLESANWKPAENSTFDVVGHTVHVLVREAKLPAEFYRIRADPIAPAQ